MKSIFKRKPPETPVFYQPQHWRRYDVDFCSGPVELQAALQRINVEGHVIVSVTQDLSKYTIVFKRFD